MEEKNIIINIDNKLKKQIKQKLILKNLSMKKYLTKLITDDLENTN